MSARRIVFCAVSLAAASGCLHDSTKKVKGVEIVTQDAVDYPHFGTIKDALDVASPGNWILIQPGIYHEAVEITVPGIHLRGMDRNGVVIDGQHRAGNGIEVFETDGVSIENLTVHDFDRATLDGEDGNEIWWNGGDGSGQIGLEGWHGAYLTTYSTGLLAGYGLFVSNAVDGSVDQVYASGFNDSGLYLGACRDCRAVISHATIENNALGYSGTNSGGHIVVEDSVFQHNADGVGPNSLNNDDQPPPQDGACDSGLNGTTTPTFATTRIDRCTIFRNNVIASNGNLSTPANSTAASIPWGAGVILIGTYADLLIGNDVHGNPNAGLLGVENPDPYPPTADTVYFQLSGNAVVGNTFADNGSNPDPHAADVVLVGGLFGAQQSVNNCFAKNVWTKTVPDALQDTWGCDKTTTPNPGGDALDYVILLQAQSQGRTSVAQPAPPPQSTMPDPCEGVPANPICP
jgi:hypothetical protein